MTNNKSRNTLNNFSQANSKSHQNSLKAFPCTNSAFTSKYVSSFGTMPLLMDENSNDSLDSPPCKPINKAIYITSNQIINKKAKPQYFKGRFNGQQVHKRY